MALSKKGSNGFTLDLVVGIQDIFKKQAKDVEKEANSLQKEFKKLQNTLNGIDEFKKLQTDLKQLENQTDATEEQIKSMAEKVESSKMSLHRAGVSTSKLADEQKRLATSLAKTSKEMKDQKDAAAQMQSAQDRVESIATGVAGAVTAGALARKLAKAGLDRDKMLRMAAASTNASLDDLSSDDSKRWRSKMIRSMGGDHDYADIVAAQTLALKTGAQGEQANTLAERSLQLTKYNKDWELEEVNRALNKMTQTDSDLSVDKAAAILDAVKKNGGDEYKDMLDSALEYSGYLRDIGVDTETAWAAALASIKGGARGTDKAFDAIKEGIAARLSDPSELEKLLGKGKTQGSLDEYITDADVRQQLKDSIGSYRQALAEGSSTAKPMQQIALSLSELYKQNPQNAKVVSENIFGVQGSEDLTKGGLQNFLGVLSGAISPDDVLKTKRSLDESVALSQSAADDVRSAWGLFTDPFINLVSDIASSSTGLTKVLSDGASAWANALNDSPLTTGALTIGGLLGAGVGVTRGGKYLYGKAQNIALKYLTGGRGSVKPPAAEATIVDDAAKAAAEGADALKAGTVADNAVKGASTAAKGAEEIATNSSILKKGTDAAGKVLKSAGKTGGKFVKGIPLLGQAISGGMFLYHALTGDFESAAGDAGALVGGIAGEALGTAALPGAGTFAGGIAGAMSGDELARSWYREHFGSNEPQIEQVENTVASITTNNEQAAALQTSAEPSIVIEMSNEFNFDLGIVNGEDESAQEMLVKALRTATPEMQRQLKATLQELFSSADNIALTD
ncbi:hypothetical protein J7Y46_003052 [Vibrio parahaemolyticus]|nr:hypothetical protein [Vibrio parahaemolyticus]